MIKHESSFNFKLHKSIFLMQYRLAPRRGDPLTKGQKAIASPPVLSCATVPCQLPQCGLLRCIFWTGVGMWKEDEPQLAGSSMRRHRCKHGAILHACSAIKSLSAADGL